MWVIYAFGSAFFAGVTSILAKCGIRKTDSNTATALRTVVVLIFSWLMVFMTGTQSSIFSVSARSWIFLILSGAATGVSWLCYFKALQLGDVNKVVPIDKSSTVLTIIFAVIFLNEEISWLKVLAVIAIGTGTFLMIQRKKSDETIKKRNNIWMVYAFLSAVFAALTAILGKVGISDVDSNLGTAIRTGVVLIMSWLIVFISGKQHTVLQIPRRELAFIIFSGIATGASWLCYYRALHDGLASVVVPIDKLSILVTVAFSYFVFKEKLNIRSFIGLILIVAGTFAMIF